MIVHKPVLLKEVLDFIPKDCKLVVDCTLGHGWHTLAIIDLIGKDVNVIWIDIDKKMLDKAVWILNEKKDHVIFVYWSYGNIDKILEENGNKKADFVLVDLWVNLEHFKDWERGFSIKWEWDLDMRFDQNNTESAYNIINKYWKQELKNMFVDYAEFAEKKALEIADKIVFTRSKTPIKTTQEFKSILNESWLGDKACAVIFQALRIQVNHELDNLKILLNKINSILNPWWRVCVISYHSLEDRIVKNEFNQLAETWKFKILTKKVVKPNYLEVWLNKAARSAKMRVIQKS